MHTEVAQGPEIVESSVQPSSHRGREFCRWARRAAAAAAGAALAITTIGAVPAAAAPAPTCATTSVAAAESSAQSAFVNKLNSLRGSKGLGSLAVNSRITGPAVSWSETMSAQNWLHHARDTGADDGVEPNQDYVTLVTSVVANWRRVGENVGVSGMSSWCSAGELDASTSQAVQLLHDAFVNSSGHYANMVGDFNQVGIGVEIDSDQLWVTVRFAKGDLPLHDAGELEQAKLYVDGAYQLFIGRSATSAEKSHWAPIVLEQGRSKLTGALAVSSEWAGVRIDDLYRQILGRSPDAAGRQAWLSSVAGGTRLEDVAAGFYGSTEYFNSVGRSNSGYLDSLYEDILGRSADRSGREFWVGAISRGMSRRQVAAEFYASVESRRDRVTSLYLEVLERRPDSVGFTHWTAQLRHTGDVALAATLASSGEFWNRVTR